MTEAAAQLPTWATKKLGPLPVAGWLVAVPIGIWISTRFTRSAGDAADLGGEAPSLPDRATYGVDGSAPVESVADTNDSWYRRALAFLIAEGIDAYIAEQTIKRYLQGDTLTTTEAARISAIVKAIGPAPDYVPSALANPTPTPQRNGDVARVLRDAAFIIGSGVGPRPQRYPTPKVTLAGYEAYTAHYNMQRDGKLGSVWVTNLGGVHTAGSAEYRGSLWGKLRKGEYARNIVPNGRGYNVVTNQRTVTFR